MSIEDALIHQFDWRHRHLPSTARLAVFLALPATVQTMMWIDLRQHVELLRLQVMG